MELRVANPKLTSEFAAMLAALSHPLPWNFSPPERDEIGVIRDANDKAVLTVDADCNRSDEDVLRVVGAIVVAVNTCGGFRCEPPAEETGGKA